MLPAETPGTSGLMTLATGVVIIAALSVAREVLIPITLAVLLSFVLAPLVSLLRRCRLGRIPAVLLAVLVAFGIILGLGGVIGAQIAGLADDVPRYASVIQQKVQAVQSIATSRFSGLGNRFARQFASVGAAPADSVRPPATQGEGATAGRPTGPGAPATAQPNAPPKPTVVEVRQPEPSPLDLAQRILAPVLSPVATMGIVVVVAIFILLQQEDLRDRLIRLFGARDLHRTMTAMDDAASRLSRYFLTQLAINVAFGIVVGLGLLLIGVPSPVLWGIVAAMMRFVPYVGSFLSAALPLALAAAVDPGWSLAVWTAALFVGGELIMGQVVEPLVYGHSTGLSPVSVVVSAIFWGWLWGPIGLILSMPLTLCLVVLGRHVDRLEFLDVLLGDRPALTPIETFYHRMLAGDVDEVQDYAEHLLKTRSLSAYYDEVAIKGLRLAATDIDRGLLTEEQIVQIGEGVETLVSELADSEDRVPDAAAAEDSPVAPTRDVVDPPVPLAPADAAALADRSLPPAWSAADSVLCVAGRGQLDDMAAAMLAQLLGKHGFGVRVAAHEVVGSRAALAALDLDGVRVVCICYAAISGTPSHLRYAVRRLRTRLPEATILVGLWPDESVSDERLRAAIGADLYAASLRDAVVACLGHARAATPAAPGKAA